jgi:hypothetical protein
MVQIEKLNNKLGSLTMEFEAKEITEANFRKAEKDLTAQMAEATKEINKRAEEEVTKIVQTAEKAGVPEDGIFHFTFDDGSEFYLNAKHYQDSPDQAFNIINAMVEDIKQYKGLAKKRRSDRDVKERAKLLGVSLKDYRRLAKSVEHLDAKIYAARDGLYAQEKAWRAHAEEAAQGNKELYLPMMYEYMLLAKMLTNTRQALTGAGRGLRAAGTTVSGEILLQQEKALADLLEGAKNSGLTQEEIVKKMLDLPSLEDRVAMATKPGVVDAFLEVWINNLLTNLSTHVVNAGSNAIQIGLALSDRKVASVFPGSKVSGIQFKGMLFGLHSWFLDSMSLAYEGTKQAIAEPAETVGQVKRIIAKPSEALERLSGRMAELRGVEDVNEVFKFDIDPRMKAFRAETFGITSKKGLTGWIGAAIDLIGEFERVAGRGLMTSDQWFKGANYRMELFAQAYQIAASENLEATPEKFMDRVNNIIANPPEYIVDMAEDFAALNTFTSELGPLGEAFKAWARRNPFGRVIAPFIGTPTNIVFRTIERTPMAVASARFRADWNAGGAKRQIAMARIATGSAIMGTAAALAAAGLITGKGPERKELRDMWYASGKQPWSIRIGSKWYSYIRFDPVGALLGMVARWTELAGSMDEISATELTLNMMLALSDVFLDKTYLTSISGVFAAMRDPIKKGPGFIRRLAGTVIPRGVAQWERIQDPNVRKVYNWMDSIQSQTPFISGNLPPMRNIFADPVILEGGLGPDIMSPIYTSKVVDDQRYHEYSLQHCWSPISINCFTFNEHWGHTPLT